jgi:predicted RNase H-like HicB family nuclease
VTRFLVIIEEGPTSYGVSAPDVEGCFAVGATKTEALQRFQEALQAHLGLLADEGESMPYPSFTHDYVDVPLPTITTITPTKAS